MSYRKIFLRDGGTITIENGVITDGTLPEDRPAGPYVMPDISGASGEFISPVDGSLISSRSQLRAHNRRHKVEQIGNDYLFDRRKADVMARYGRNPDGSFKRPLDGVSVNWIDPN